MQFIVCTLVLTLLYTWIGLQGNDKRERERSRMCRVLHDRRTWFARIRLNTEVVAQSREAIQSRYTVRIATRPSCLIPWLIPVKRVQVEVIEKKQGEAYLHYRVQVVLLYIQHLLSTTFHSICYQRQPYRQASRDLMSKLDKSSKRTCFKRTNVPAIRYDIVLLHGVLHKVKLRMQSRNH